MHSVLDELNRRPGVTGSMVATSDGMAVVSRLRPGWNEETAAALVSSLLMAARSAGDPAFRRFVLTGTRGKVIVHDVGDAYLVVTTHRHIDLERGLLDVEAAAATLRKLGRLRG